MRVNFSLEDFWLGKIFIFVYKTTIYITDKLPHCEFLKTIKSKSTNKNNEAFRLPVENSYHIRTRSRNTGIFLDTHIVL